MQQYVVFNVLKEYCISKEEEEELIRLNEGYNTKGII
jgi:hypothetical protein